MATTDEHWKEAFDRLHANLRKRAEDAGAAWSKKVKEVDAVESNEDRAMYQRHLDGLGGMCHELNSVLGTANSLKNWTNAKIAKETAK